MARRGGAALRAIAGAAFAAVLLGGCVGLQTNPNVVGEYSERISPYNYREEGSVALLVVGVDGARYIRKESYFPLFVQVVNKSKATWTVSSESFTLEDPLGRQYSVAPAAEVAAHYPRLDLDRRMFQQNRAITSTYVSLDTHISSDFFPSSSRPSLRVDHVNLPPHGYMEDVLYFPIPESGLNDVTLRLLFKTKEIDEPIQVVFTVPRTLGALEKDDTGKRGGRPR